MTSSPAARPDRIRSHNLALVLGHVHRDGALSRAELTSRLQVSRSTVAALVADLVDLRLLEESVPSGGSGVGRPSHVVRPDPRGPWVAAVDVDVNSVAVAAVGIGGEVLSRTTVTIAPTRFTPQDLLAVVTSALPRVAETAGRGTSPNALGVSVPGTVDRDTGRVGVAPNLGWRNVPLRGVLAGLPDPAPGRIVVANDADLAVSAEHLRGSARDCTDVVFLQGRVGIGAGMVLGGRQAGGVDGHAGELGHVVLELEGRQCHCGRYGCVETVLGADALLTAAGSGRLAELFTAARSGPGRERASLEAAADSLGRTVGMVVNLLNPQLVVLGGHLAELFELDEPMSHLVRTAVSRYALETADRVRLVAAELGPDAALLGAAEAAFAPLLADPVAVLAAQPS